MLNSYKHSKGISVATENYLHEKKMLLSKKVIYKTEYYMILYFNSVKYV